MRRPPHTHACKLYACMTTPHPPQPRPLKNPTRKKRRDLLAKAKTGTGKTLAFLIPAIERLARQPAVNAGGPVRCLVLAPSRELAEQIRVEAEKLLSTHSGGLGVQVGLGLRLGRSVGDWFWFGRDIEGLASIGCKCLIA